MLIISHLKEICIDAELDLVDTALWYSKMARKDYTVGAADIESGVDDPDPMFFENYVCGALRNYTGYCDPEVDKLVNRQSMEANPQKRKEIVWQIERTCRVGRAPGAVLPGRRLLLAALGQGPDADDQQHLQWLAHGGRLARQVRQPRSMNGFSLEARFRSRHPRSTRYPSP